MSSLLNLKKDNYRLLLAQRKNNYKRQMILNKIALSKNIIIGNKKETNSDNIINNKNNENNENNKIKHNIFLTIKTKVPFKPEFKILKNPFSLDSNVKIYLYTICYNEEFIIPHFLKHYYYVDKIFVYDNCSNDNTIKLLKMDSRCEIIKFSSNFDDRVNQYIKNNCWKQHRNVCDYAIVCDIDEFLWINNNTSIKDLLQSYKNKKKSIDYLPTIGYNMVHKNVIDNNILLVDQIKYGIRDNMYSKLNIFNVNSVKNMNFGPGSHLCNIETFSTKVIMGPKILLLHYKFIGGKKRLRNRYVEFGKRLSQNNKNRNEGMHYLKNPDIEYDSLYARSTKILI